MSKSRLLLTVIFVLMVPIVLCASPEEGVSIETKIDSAVVSINIDSNIAPNIRYLSKEGCWNMDLIGKALDCRSEPFAFSQGPLKLVSCQTLSKLPPIQRFAFYVRDFVEMKMKRDDRKILLTFKYSGGLIGKTDDNDGRVPQPLLAPVVEKEEVVVELSNTTAFSILKELAKRASLNVKFRDLPPRKVAVKARGENPKDALEKVCQSIGMVLTHESDGWWISLKDNPLLQFSGEGTVDFSAFSGMKNSEALKKICSGTSVESILGKLPSEVLSQRVMPVPEPVSPRAWISLLLKSHGLDERVVLAK